MKVLRGGVYVITNTETGEQYVGCSKQIRPRKLSHFRLLRCGRHHNPELQAAFTYCGEDAFRFDVLQRVPEQTPIFHFEQDWIRRLRPVFNVPTGRPNLKNREHWARRKAAAP